MAFHIPRKSYFRILSCRLKIFLTTYHCVSSKSVQYIIIWSLATENNHFDGKKKHPFYFKLQTIICKNSHRRKRCKNKTQKCIRHGGETSPHPRKGLAQTRVCTSPAPGSPGCYLCHLSGSKFLIISWSVFGFISMSLVSKSLKYSNELMLLSLHEQASE